MNSPETMVFRKGQGVTTEPTNLDCWVCVAWMVRCLDDTTAIFTHDHNRKMISFDSIKSWNWYHAIKLYIFSFPKARITAAAARVPHPLATTERTSPARQMLHCLRVRSCLIFMDWRIFWEKRVCRPLPVRTCRRVPDYSVARKEVLLTQCSL